MVVSKAKTGFTIVELVVAAALFATIVTVAVNLFVLTLRQPLTEVDNQHLQEEIDFVFEGLASNLSDLTIDYDEYAATITNPQATLYLHGDTQEVYITLVGGQIMFTNTTTGLSSPLTSLNNDDVEIDTLSFYIYPQSDPADVTNNVNYQPAVVMRIAGHSVKQTQRTFQAQSFLTLRTYVR